jgi:hypothetical protein
VISTRFKKVDYTLNVLISEIAMGDIGLPDIQRPFIWTKTKVRDLFDSMYRGFPVGYLLFWKNRVDAGSRYIGDEEKQRVAERLIVDGQQRLTSLYAVLTGTPVLREDFSQERIQIAFRPIDGRFEVANSIISRDPEWIPDVTRLWAPNVGLMKLTQSYLTVIRQRRDLTDAEEQEIADRIDRVKDLQNYPFTALEMAEDVDEEQVAEVFVRINSQGTTLTQTDFILTLMSVFWDKGRRQLEEFVRASRTPSKGPSPYNFFIDPEADQLLRVGVGLAFRRARLELVYSLLRGKDMETGELSEDRRVQQFELLDQAQQYALDLQNWHDFFKAIVRSGYRRGEHITSKNALLYTYVLYLIGKRDFGLDHTTLRDVIARWFFMSTLTGRYTTSPETQMEADLARLRDLQGGDAFVTALDLVIRSTLTRDYWDISLPAQLSTSSPRSPSLFAYVAALNLLDARVLFSKLKVAELLDPTKAKKAALERHHLFPRGYLKSIDIKRPREVNQIANYAFIEWPDNATISAAAPSSYWPLLAAKLAPDERRDVMYWHALPDDWENLEYHVFLEKRRKLIAAVIRDGYMHLAGDASKEELAAEEAAELEARASRRRSTEELLAAGEGSFVEFKESARWSYIQGQKEKLSLDEVVRALAGFLNAHGGSLLIGVNDEGDAIGLGADYKSIQGHASRDGFMNWLTGALRDRLGVGPLHNLGFTFETIDSKEICRIDVDPSSEPVYVDERDFHVRAHNTTQRLSGPDVVWYIKRHWRRI